MKSLRVRLTVWFGLVFLAIVAAFTLLSHHTLEMELRQKTWQKDYPEHPDWKLHGSFSEEEVQDISSELIESAMLWVVPLAILALASGYWLAYQSLRPIANVNRQLEAKNSSNLREPIALPEADVEFRSLLRQLNDLLSRLDASFSEMTNYSAKVAHELRTPLMIMRLKVEQAGGRIAPELVGELEKELHRLTYVVDQALFMARAEQGRVAAQRIIFDLTKTVAETVEDFQLLAAEEQRNFTLQTSPACWVSADQNHVRQIIHNLLTNALAHGDGDLSVRLNRNGEYNCLTIANRTRSRNGAGESSLGLGLRVVSALLRLEPEMKFHRRQGKGYYVTRFRIPCIAAPQPLKEMAG